MSQYPKILIDGYNLIFRFEKIKTEKPYALEKAREKLLSRLASYGRTKKISLTVVFDGDDVGVRPQSYVQNGVEIVFSQPPITADSVIKKIIQAEANPQNITVVTSDKPVADFATSAGCKTFSSESFQQKLENMVPDFNYEDKYERQLSDEEVREWVSLFNQSKDHFNVP
jgi:predicted RNA-binding protein with PIN domain